MSCFLCFEDDVPSGDRWDFKFGDDHFYLCRGCHSYFKDAHHFEQFIQNWNRQRLFGTVRAMARLLALGAPNCIIAHQADVILKRCARDPNISSYLKTPV